MIVLVKLYQRTNTRQDVVQKSLLGAQPYAVIEKDKLINILDEEILDKFPNNGKVYVPEFVSLQAKEAFRIYELQESHWNVNTKQYKLYKGCCLNSVGVRYPSV